MELSIARMAVEVLSTSNARDKATLSRQHAARVLTGLTGAAEPVPMGQAVPADTPARPDRPELLAPRDMPRRRTGSLAGRTALIHAIAHIELNAIDLHWDILARFCDVPMPPGFAEDWVRAADDEAKHFNLLADWLDANGSQYGALPAHAGLWQAAQETADDLLARLAVVPMVLEARGLDVTPAMIAIFDKAGDSAAVAALTTISGEEVAHVAYGSKWFNFLCGRDNLDPKTTFHALVRRHFRGHLKPPFDEARRAEAGLPPDFYWPLVDEAD